MCKFPDLMITVSSFDFSHISHFQLVHRGGLPWPETSVLSTEVVCRGQRRLSCPPRWFAVARDVCLVHRGGLPWPETSVLSTEVVCRGQRRLSCPPRWFAVARDVCLVHRGGLPWPETSDLSTEVGRRGQRCLSCPPRWFAVARDVCLVHRGGSPWPETSVLSTEVVCRGHGSCPETSVLGCRFLNSIILHISLHHIHVLELRSASAVPQEQSGLAMYGLHHCYSAILHGRTSAVFASLGVMAGRILQLSSI